MVRQIGDSNQPEACEAPHSIFAARDGVLFGLANLGPSGRPAIFRITPDGWVLRVLHELEPGTRLGQTQGLSEGEDGSLYGTAVSGGEFGKGYVFRCGRDGTGYQVLHQFNGPDGDSPTSKVVEGSDGFLYGLTARGGTNTSMGGWCDSEDNCWPTTIFHGVLYRVDRQGNQFSVMHHFRNEAVWERDLVRAPDRTIVLADPNDRNGGSGALFRVEPETGALLPIHRFPTDLSEGTRPGNLQSHENGYIYGLALYGLFRIRPDGSDFRVIKMFSLREGEPPDLGRSFHSWNASAPNVLLVERQGPASRLWGLFEVNARTGIGDPVNLFKLFRIDPDGSNYYLYDYDPLAYDPIAYIDGSGPPFATASDGWIYGVSRGPTRIASGDTVYRMLPDGRQREILYRFLRRRSDYDAPSAISRDGTLYGSVLDPSGADTFRVRAFARHPPDYETETLFSAAQRDPFFGPFKALLHASDGNLYFVDEGGFGYGAHVSMASTDGAIRKREFYLTYIDKGWFHLLESADGFLYGSAVDESKRVRSFVFRCGRGLTDFKELGGWNSVVEGAPDPAKPALIPQGPLIEGSDNFLYIFSDTLSIQGLGQRQVELYRIAKDGSSVRRTELDRDFGYFPHGSLVEGSDQALYYVTERKLCRMDKSAAKPNVISDLDESMSGEEDQEFLVRGDPGTLYVASSGWESSGYFLRIMELGETGGSRLIYQSLTTEFPAALKLRALKYTGNRGLLGIAESFGGTNGWGLIFELAPGGTNHPPAVVRRMETQPGMIGQPFALDIPESLFSDPDPGQSLRIKVEGVPVFPPGLVFDPVTRRLTGVPQTGGTATVLVRATDDGNPPLTASLSFALDVQPGLRFEKSNRRWSADGFDAVVRGPAGRRAQLEASSDFSTWIPVNVVELNNQPQPVRDEAAGASPAQRFYRLRLVP